MKGFENWFDLFLSLDDLKREVKILEEEKARSERHNQAVSKENQKQLEINKRWRRSVNCQPLANLTWLQLGPGHYDRNGNSWAASLSIYGGSDQLGRTHSWQSAAGAGHGTSGGQVPLRDHGEEEKCGGGELCEAGEGGAAPPSANQEAGLLLSLLPALPPALPPPPPPSSRGLPRGRRGSPLPGQCRVGPSDMNLWQ